MQQQRPIIANHPSSTTAPHSRRGEGEAFSRLARELAPRPDTLIPLAICLVSALAGRLVYLRHPWDGDAAILIYSGKAITHGARFGYDLCDNKFPTAALWNGLWWRALGSHWPAYVIAASLMVAAAIAVLAKIAHRHAGRAAVLPTILFALVYANFCPALFGGFQLETSLTLFSVIAAAFALSALTSSRCAPAFICGLLSGCALYLKPTGLSIAATFFAIQLLQTAGWIKLGDRPTLAQIARQSAALFVGLLIPVAFALTYLIAANILQDMPRLYRQINDYAQNSVWDIYTTLKILIAAAILLIPLCLRRRPGSRSLFTLASYAASGERRRTPRGQDEGPISILRVFTIIWLIIEFLGVIAQRRMYGYHFLVLAAPAALLFGQIPAKPRCSTLLLPMAPAIFFSMWAATWQIYGRTDSPRLAVSDYLLQHAQRGDSIWMDNMPRLLMETDLHPASRHLITLPFYNTDTSPQQMGSELLRDLANHPPTYIIVPTDGQAMLTGQCHFMAELADRPERQKSYCAVWADIFDFIHDNYQSAATIGDRTIYTRRLTSIETVDIR